MTAVIFYLGQPIAHSHANQNNPPNNFAHQPSAARLVPVTCGAVLTAIDTSKDVCRAACPMAAGKMSWVDDFCLHTSGAAVLRDPQSLSTLLPN